MFRQMHPARVGELCSSTDQPSEPGFLSFRKWKISCRSVASKCCWYVDLLTRPEGTPCASPLGQHDSGILYKSPGQAHLEMPFQDGKTIEQHFVCVGGHTKESLVTKKKMSLWIVGTIALVYSSLGLQCPIGVRGSTRGIASSWAWCSSVGTCLPRAGQILQAFASLHVCF